MSSPIVGPIAPYNNPPIMPQWFQPRLFFISDLTLGMTTTVTTSVNHNYVIGQRIRLLIPQNYGSVQLNDQEGYVISIPSANQVVVNIDSQFANSFISDPTYGPTMPQIVPIGDVNSGAINANGIGYTSTTIPGSFINISPFPAGGVSPP